MILLALAFLAVLGLYLGTNVYIARVLGHWLRLTGRWAWCFGIGYGLLAAAFLIAHLLPLPPSLSRLLSLVGGVWLAGYILLLLAVPVTHGLLRGKGGPMAAVILLVLLLVYILTGLHTASSIRTTRYTVPCGKGHGLRLALVSDLHIGEIIGEKQVSRMVEAVNALEADYILLAGDIFDTGPEGVRDPDSIAACFARLRSRKGVYACLGNHDGGFRGQEDAAAALLTAWGVHVLQDQAAVLEDIQIVGRIDRSHSRMDAAALTAGLSPDRLTVMLDHQPFELRQAQAAGVDLLLCGHTHRGQVFPANLITRAMYEIDYGILQEDGFAAIVSSGAGTWGPRMRIGSVCEVVCIDIQ